MRYGRANPATRSFAALAGGTFRFFLFGNLFLALCATLWAYSTYRVLNVSTHSANPWLLAFVAGGVLIVYTVDRVFTFERPDPETVSERHRWIARHRTALLGLLGCATGVTLAALPFLDNRVLILAAAAGLVALAYSLPIRKGFTVGLKELGLLKIFLIAGVWAVVTTVLPPLDAGDPILNRDLVLLFAERFLFVFAITLPFDIRDRALDRASDIKTIPVRVGTRTSKAMVVGAVALYLALKVAHYGLESPLVLVPAAVSAGYIALLLAALSEARHDYYFSLLWDGAILVQALLALAFAHRGGP
jgi:4-hydroxybenzoate polyprenyltransferase